MDLVFASHNKNKLMEVKSLIPSSINLSGLSDIGCEEEIPETGATIKENAVIKARYVFENFKINCFSDDSGLEVEALNGAPGVYSARYAGEQKNTADNNAKLLYELKNKTNRKARFVTIIALIIEGKEYFFEGEIKGTIAFEPRGSNGFGYDPLFIPTGHRSTFAEMDASVKNSISHRAVAVQKLVRFLSSLTPDPYC
jgi:XTP/dITP diphosphohydrolase